VKSRALLLVTGVLLVSLAAAARDAGIPDELSPEETQARLWEHRNLGKAFYENPATQYEAVDELRKALELAPESVRERINQGLALLRAGRTEEGIAELERAQEQDPAIPHTWFNLGIEHKRGGRYDEAIVQLEGMRSRVPDEAITHYNLGVLYKLEGDDATSLARFEAAARLDPDLAGVHFQLASAYRQAGRAEAAAAEMARFRELKARKADDPIPEDLEWSWYSELYDPIGPMAVTPPTAELAFERLEMADATAASGQAAPALPAGLVVLDADRDRAPDLLSWSGGRARLWLGGLRGADAGLASLDGVLAVVPGDIDDDGLADLLVLTSEGPRLLRNTGGAFAMHPATLPSRPFRAAVWLDYDHDYDEDLLLLGAEPALLRNQGDGTFGDRTADFPFVAGAAVAATRLDLVADSQAMDLVVAYADRPGVLYRDLLGGRYEARPLPGLPALRDQATLAARDVDRDGWTDLAIADASTLRLLYNDRAEGFEPTAGTGAAPVVLVDLENRGAVDLLAGPTLLRQRAPRDFDQVPLPPELAEATAAPPAGLAAADFDGDGRLDLAVLPADRPPVVLANRTESPDRWLAVTLEGVKNLSLAPGSEVEVRAGSLYQKQTYQGVPLHFGLAGHEAADAVRITWPNGLIQNETRQPAGTRPLYEEAPRLSGSCPMIFTWNGTGFEFITDVLGVAPLGASAGDGTYFPVDHDEAIQIAGSSLALRPDGTYEIRITEELREVAFLDEIRLLAVDHPHDTEVLTNQKFQGPPYPELRLFAVTERHHPRAARDHQGRDVLDRLLARNRVYPDAYDRDFSGVAELHHLELELDPLPAAAPGERTLLVLSGWVDWADGSTFLATSQGGGPGLVMPRLLVHDDAGGWIPVIEDMGIPAGKPKTIAVDVTGLLPAGGATLRIETSLVVYWDEIYLARAPETPRLTLTSLDPATADLRFRGFSRVEIHPERKQPERFVYADVRPTAMWNPTPGLYTRYGDVTELLSAVDDRFVVMGSGDEVRLLFDGSALPALPDGWTRDFLLHVDGWAKDGDANTAHSQTVEPLPFHGMPQYPYEDPHRYPDDPEHLRYREHYLTRPALRLVRPLTEGLRADRETTVREAADESP
jgi:tetratricopeptide (TPR) repeat protein